MTAYKCVVTTSPGRSDWPAAVAQYCLEAAASRAVMPDSSLLRSAPSPTSINFQTCADMYAQACLGLLLLLLCTWAPSAEGATVITKPSATNKVFSVTENKGIGIFVTDMTMTKATAANAVAWSLTGSADCIAAFQFQVPTAIADQNKATLITKKAIDYETKTTYSCTVQVQETGTGGSTQTAPFTVNLNNVFDVAPSFSPTSFTCSFAENVAANTLCTTAIPVTDSEKASSGDAITCTLTGNGAPNIFDAVSSGGDCKVKVVKVNDRDTMPITVFQPVIITATDKGGNTGTATLTVSITDVNDNTPSCSTGSLTLSRGEDLTVNNYVVASFACTDIDDGVNAQMECATTSTGFTASMTGSTCTLKLSAALDYDTMSPKYKEAVVTVNDKATSGARTATYSFTLSVTDINDNTPAWGTWTPAKPASATTVIKEINENAPSGTSVFTIAATDADPGTAIVYSIVSVTKSLGPYFTIDSTSGVVKLARSDLDRDTMGSGANDGNVDIVVKASDGTKSITSTVRMNIKSVNEKDPEFTPTNVYSDTALTEKTAANTDVLTMTVVDKDVPATPVVCSITSGNSAGVWQLKTGATNIVQTKKELKVDAPDNLATSYVLGVTCEDNSGSDPKKSATATVSLSIATFTNDHQPTITLNPTSVTVSETATTVKMSTITVADSDGGTPGSLTCSISSPSGSPFVTKGCTEVQRTGTLDYETTTSYSVVVQVTDAGSPPKLNSATLTVTVGNADDNDPVCSSSPYSFSIAEGSATSTPVGTVTCTDKDNPSFTYALVGVSLPFSISSTTGAITVSGTLDYDSGTTFYSFKVTAKDGGSRGLTATAQVTVILTPVNQATPTFTPATETIPETFTVGQQVKLFTATDGDAGPDGVVTYSIKSVSNSGLPKFNIDSASGSITLAQPLDYDAASFTPKEYVIKVEGKDGSSPGTQKSSTGTLTVAVSNVNDNTPVCGTSTYTGSVAENSGVGDAVTGGPVAATDGDGDTLIYSIESGNTGTVFQISSSTGAVTRTANPLDYETTKVYNLAIRAKDGTTASAKSTTCSYRISITDSNEATPVFSPTTAGVTKAEDTAVSTLLYTASATDADTSQTLTYGFTASSTVFSIDPNTGKVSLLSALDYETATNHEVKITAKDSVSTIRTGTMTLVLTVTDVNEFTPTCSLDPVTATRNEATTGDCITFTCSDGDTTKTLVYTIVSVNGAGGAGKFGFSSNKLVLNTAIDYDTATAERVNTIITTVSDSGPGTAKVATFTSTVSILPVNEHTPAFASGAITGTVEENKPADTTILTLTATDDDKGSNHGTISWSIVSGNTHNYFKLVGNVLKVNLPPDRETATSATLRVRASDGPGLNSEKNVVITITDANDNAPVFNPSSKTITVVENATVGSRLDDFSVASRLSDGDTGANAAITLSILSGADGKFRLDTSTSKILEVAAALSATTKSLYNVVIRAVDGGTSPKQTTDTTITINVVEINDATPVFSPTTSTVSLNESTAVGATVFDAHATDTDGGLAGTVKFSLASGDIYSRFLVQEVSGKVVLKSALDYEQPQKVYFLVIHATDSGSPKKTATMTLTVSVTDINDNAPVFTSATSKIIDENVGTGFTVMTVTATDADTGPNGQVEYAFDTATTTFSLNSASGVITTLINPDREAVETHVLRVKATDKGTPKLTSFQTIQIVIADKNDNTPTFSGVPFTIAVAENKAVGFDVTTVAASDNDKPGTPNSQITYSLFPNDGISDTTVFSIGSSDGKIKVAKALNREAVSLYQYQIRATDAGSPVLMGTFAINISITDINDNTPVITGSPYTASIIENAAKGSVVQQITATDADIGVNKILNYTIVDGDTGSVFATTTDGKVVTAKTNGLDRETTAQYILKVRVKDSGTPSLSATATVTVNVADFNDNAPSFGTATTTRSVAELVAVGTNVGARVVATDRDIGVNAAISYIITTQTPAVNHFKVVASTGQIQTNLAAIDRETIPQYVLKLEARDNGVPSLTGTITVTVTITDVNDNIPAFVANYTTGITLDENSAIGTVVANLTATDGDLAGNPNTNISYTIDTTRLQGSRASIFFQIDSSTGVITVKTPVDREVDTAFSFYVNATDAGVNNLRSSTFVYILINDVNDNAPIFNPPFYNTEMCVGDIYNTLITTIKATDADKGANAEVGYRFAENAIYVIVAQDTGKVTRNAAQSATAGMKLLYYVVAEDKGSPTQRSQTILRVDVHDPATTMIKIVFSMSHSDFTSKVAQITQALRGTLLTKYPNCIVRFWRSEVSAFTNTVARRLLANGVAGYFYVLADNTTGSPSNVINSKTFLTNKEAMLYWQAETSGTPTTALRGSAFTDTPVVSVEPYPTTTTTVWYKTVAGIAGLTVACAVVLVLLVVGTFFAVRYCNKQRYKTLRVTRLDDKPYVTVNAKREHPVPQYQIKNEKLAPPSYERTVQSPPQSGTGVYRDRNLWVGAGAAGGAAAAAAGATRAADYERAPSAGRNESPPHRLIRTGNSPANDGRGPTPVELNF